MSYADDSVYIMCDGTSHYGVYGFDVDDDIDENDSEVVEGPFDEWPEERIDELNNQMYF